MKIVSTLAIALSLAALTSAKAAIAITEVHPNGSGNGSYGADWFELTNTGTSAVNITGWKIDDSSFSFGSAAALSGITSIGAGESVIFLETTSNATLDAFRAAWFGTNTPANLQIGMYNGSGVGLSTSGDGVAIFNASGTTMAQVSFGAASSAATFSNPSGANGTITQISSVGVNGAYRSFNGAEVGSPGSITAVPEPSTMAAIALAAAIFVTLRWTRRTQPAA